MTQDRGPVLFFDGVCGLCHGFVQFVLKADTHKIFLFSFLQSDYAKQGKTYITLGIAGIVCGILGLFTGSVSLYILISKRDR